MSYGNRLGDIAASVPLAQTMLIQASGGSRPVVRQEAFRAAQINLGVDSVASGGGSDTLDAVLQDSDPPKYLDQNNIYDGTDDGSEKLRADSSTNTKLAIPFTPSKDVTIFDVRLMLSQLGSVAAGKTVWAEIDTDSSGPADTLVSGAQAVTKSRAVEAQTISSSIEEKVFWFDDGIDLTSGTQYWIILAGDYNVSTTDCIQAHYNTVGGTSGCYYLDGSGPTWGALASGNEDLWYRIRYLEFSDATDADGKTISHAQLTEGGWITWLGATERLEIDMDFCKPVLRIKYTVSGGNWTLGHTLTLGYPKYAPVA